MLQHRDDVIATECLLPAREDGTCMVSNPISSQPNLGDYFVDMLGLHRSRVVHPAQTRVSQAVAMISKAVRAQRQRTKSCWNWRPYGWFAMRKMRSLDVNCNTICISQGVDLHGRSISTILDGICYNQPFPGPIIWGADRGGGLDGVR